MMILGGIDFDRSCAELLVNGVGVTENDLPTIDRLLHVARALGLREVRVRDERGDSRSFRVDSPIATASSAAVPSVSAPEAGGDRRAAPNGVLETARRASLSRIEIEPRRTPYEYTSEYVVRLRHGPESLRPMSGFVALALATHLQSNSELLKVRLALYEILANVLEHGRPLQAGAVLEVGLALQPGDVRGWIHDECMRFDPRDWPSVPVADLVSGRSTRGYGIHLVRQILGTLEHSFDGSGNTLTFRKEIPTVSSTNEQVLFSSETFKVVRRPDADDGGVRIDLAGHLDVDSAPILVEILRSVLKQGMRRIELDLHDVPFISSMGIGSLIALIGEAREPGGDIVLHAMTEELRSAFQMLDLLDFVTIR